MKLLIPSKVKDIITDVDHIELELIFKHNSSVIVLIPLEQASSVSFIELHDSVFNECLNVRYKILYINGTHEYINFDTKEQAKKQPLGTQYVKCKKCNKTCNKELFAQIHKKINETETVADISLGSKNLLYFSVYFNKSYTDLLNLSIESIIRHSEIKFDILIITDKKTKKLIQKLSFYNKIKPKFHLTETPIDGVQASQNKTRIFEYKNISKYNKILFLDCDVIAVKDINPIFNQNLQTNTLYTAYNNNLTFDHFKTIHHGFTCLSDEFVKEMERHNQMPFNAGQFLFRNTERMKVHFNNLNWMMENWNGEYFFEQCFMCYYFCKAHLTNSEKLHRYVSLVSTVDNAVSNITQSSCLIHFISPSLEAKAKLAFIEKFFKI